MIRDHSDPPPARRRPAAASLASSSRRPKLTPIVWQIRCTLRAEHPSASAASEGPRLSIWKFSAMKPRSLATAGEVASGALETARQHVQKHLGGDSFGGLFEQQRAGRRTQHHGDGGRGGQRPAKRGLHRGAFPRRQPPVGNLHADLTEGLIEAQFIGPVGMDQDAVAGPHPQGPAVMLDATPPAT